MSRATHGSAALAALALACASLACGPARPAPTGPSVLLVTLDTVRADYLSCYGYPRETTPNLDALAADGARFELCVSTSGLTPVSHASILTGLNQDRHGVRVMDAGSHFALDASVPSVATRLRDAGWRTGAFLSAWPVSARFGLDQGFDTFRDGLGGEEVVLEQLPGGDTRWDGGYQRRSDATTDEALAWLDEVEGPFFAWLHYWDPHDGRQRPPEEVWDRFGLVSDPPEDPEELAKLLYATELAYVDEQLGRVLDALAAEGRLDDTVVVVTADHGEGLFEHDWHHHKILYQEQLHVPLIVRLPEGPRGAVLAPLVRTIDVAPTVLDAAGLDAGAVDGASLLPLLRGEDEPPRIAYADALNEFDRNARLRESRPQDLLLYAAMDARWKLIHRPRDPAASELYDLAADPDESENLFTPDHPEARRLLEHLRARGPFRLEGFGASSASDAEREAMDGLGYVGDDEPDDPGPEDDEPGDPGPAAGDADPGH